MFLTLIISLLLCQSSPGLTNQTRTTRPEKAPDSITQQKTTQLPRPVPKPPKVTLQQALGIAERYIEREKIDVTSFYLIEAKLIFPTKKVEDQQWHFWWVSVTGELGNYIEITVTMDGEVRRIPSM